MQLPSAPTGTTSRDTGKRDCPLNHSVRGKTTFHSLAPCPLPLMAWHHAPYPSWPGTEHLTSAGWLFTLEAEDRSLWDLAPFASRTLVCVKQAVLRSLISWWTTLLDSCRGS